MGQTKLKMQLWSFSTAENEVGQKDTPGADVKQETTVMKDSKNISHEHRNVFCMCVIWCLSQINSVKDWGDDEDMMDVYDSEFSCKTIFTLLEGKHS